MPTQNEPFVPQEDRPEVRIDPNLPVAQLKVRDLQALLSSAVLAKLERVEHKALKNEKLEIKELKHEKFEIKEHKYEIKEHKHEKFEIHEGLKREFEPGPDPTKYLLDPIYTTLNEVVQTVGNLAKRVDEISNQIKGKK